MSSFTPSQQSFAREILANLIGGIGYFHGSSIIDRTFSHEWDDEDSLASEGQKRVPHPEMTDPRELLTATPSRSFFPRGFYWDEGFHLLVIGAWDNDLSLEIIKSWINLVDDDGWVGREQILGEEARSKVSSATCARSLPSRPLGARSQTPSNVDRFLKNSRLSTHRTRILRR